MPQNIFRSTYLGLAWFGLLAALCAVVVVLGSYVVSASQPYRGPSLFYFQFFLFAALISRKWSTTLLIFALPLLPDLATQVEYVLRPKVKYFVAYPGLDAIVGLFAGQVFRSILIDHNLRSWLRPPPWPFGLVLVVIAISCCLTIDRNLWQSATTFSWLGLASNVFRFKHVLYGNDLAPLNDLWVYSGAVLLVICVSQTLIESKNKEELVFKPLAVALIVAGAWGVIQALTGFGLSESTMQYRSNTFGYSAVGFQPDIHAFAGHMLLGSVGLLGYMLLRTQNEVSSTKKRLPSIFVIACGISWTALILSKSRASLLFAVLVCIIFSLTFVKNHKSILLNRRLIIGVGILTLGLVILSLSGKFWLTEMWKEFRSAEALSFEKLNIISVYRLEIFAGALRMFSEFPLMGVGQGNFFHLSSILEFVGSPWITQTGGENAHNYFLQTLAELGSVGIVSFIIVFIWPYLNCKDPRKLLPVSMAILAVFLGNLYSHSLIIRENLYLLAALVALLYVQATDESKVDSDRLSKSANMQIASVNFKLTAKGRNSTYFGVSVLFCVALMMYMSFKEVSTAKNKLPFIYGIDCFKQTSIFSDGWTSGRLILPLDEGKTGMKFLIDQVQPDLTKQPLKVTLGILDATGKLTRSNEYHIESAEPLVLQIADPDLMKNEKGGGSVVLQLSHCFSPSNFGLKDDSRKLGVHVKGIEQF